MRSASIFILRIEGVIFGLSKIEGKRIKLVLLVRSNSQTNVILKEILTDDAVSLKVTVNSDFARFFGRY